MSILQLGIGAVEQGYVPDSVTRLAIRRLCGQRLTDLSKGRRDAVLASQTAFLESMCTAPIAPLPEKANQQHYELPPEFFLEVLGPHRKYSCCLWPEGPALLVDAEEAALRSTCEHAEIADGQQILELGCGWGSLSLWMARRYPNSQITAVSNSAPQRRFIEAQAADRGLTNLRVITADMNELNLRMTGSAEAAFDRVVSVEMFEHMRNYERLLSRIASWLKPDGKLFVHLFCHRELVYPFETEGASNWMGRYFFTGGIMPSADLLLRFDRDMQVIRQWAWDGRHYQRTAEAWLAQMDSRRDGIMPILQSAYGPAEARRWFHRWRMFFLAVSELFGYAQGQEWFVSHYLLRRTDASLSG
jgi:cyclopropane-fatty-acyl-phospholipid synthase